MTLMLKSLQNSSINSLVNNSVENSGFIRVGKLPNRCNRLE
jgi:hypothetical protein